MISTDFSSIPALMLNTLVQLIKFEIHSQIKLNVIKLNTFGVLECMKLRHRVEV